MKVKSQFKFTPEQEADIKAALKKYFADELEMELGDLQAVIFLEFLNQQIGRYYYNLGVTEVIAAIKEKTDDLVLLMKE